MRQVLKKKIKYDWQFQEALINVKFNIVLPDDAMSPLSDN